MFGEIFGGAPFADWIGEISMVKDLTKSMEIAQRHEEANATASASEASQEIQNDKLSTSLPTSENQTPLPTSRKSSATTETSSLPSEKRTASVSDANSTSLPDRPKGIPTRLAIEHNPLDSATSTAEQAARDSVAGVTPEEASLRQKEKKRGGLTKEQRDELYEFEQQRRKVREARIEALVNKLIERISLWTETDKGPEVTFAFREKMKLEAENLKMESFGLEMLHAIGATYSMKSNTYFNSKKPVIGGVTGFFSRLKDKGTLVKETWGTVSTAISAQMEIEDMAKMEQAGGENWTDARKVEAERRVTGKILAAAWRGSKLEVQSVLRDVCDKVLNDKTVGSAKRLERAHALQIVAEIFTAAKRTEEEETDQFVFEQLVRDAAEKKKEPIVKEKKDKEKEEKERLRKESLKLI